MALVPSRNGAQGENRNTGGLADLLSRQRGSDSWEQAATIHGNVISTASRQLHLVQDRWHLYRALLRETSYLPDPAARSYLRQYLPKRVRSSFNVKDIPKKDQRRRLSNVTHHFRGFLRTLCLANAGRSDPLLHVLSMTYGRVGKRRHQLLKAIRETDVVALPGVPDDIKGKARPPAPLGPNIMALAKSQTKVSEDVLQGPNIRRLDPQLPKNNIWERPLPKNRERNLIRAHQKDILSRLMPPLPQHEWQRLGDLATGVRRWEGPTRRRPQGTVRKPGKVSGTPDYEDMRVLWIQKELGEPRPLKARLMRSAWAKIWTQCPMVTASGNPDRPWGIQWGRVRRAATVPAGIGGEAVSSQFDAVVGPKKLP